MQPTNSYRVQEVQNTLHAFNDNLNRYAFTKNYITSSYTLSEMKEALEINQGVIQSSFTLEMSQTLDLLRERVVKYADGAPKEKHELLSKLDLLRKTRLSRGLSAVERKIDEIEKNLPTDTFPPFKRDMNGNVIEPERQLKEFGAMLARITAYYNEYSLDYYPTLITAPWESQDNASKDAEEFIKTAQLISDLNFFLTFRHLFLERNLYGNIIDFFKNVSLQNLQSLVREGRKYFAKKNFSKEFFFRVHKSGFIPPEIKYFNNMTHLQGLVLIPFLPRSMQYLPLKELNLSGSLLFGFGMLTEIPDFFGKFKNLRTLELQHNQICCLDPQTSGLEKLEILNLSHNQLREVSNLPANLQTCNLYHNQIEMLDLNSLSLSELDLTENPDQAIDANFASCPNLTILRCSTHQLPHLPLELIKHENLTMIAAESYDDFIGWKKTSKGISLKDYILTILDIKKDKIP